MTSALLIKERTIRIALVGCGRISRNHIKAIALHHDRSELVALCDTEQERLDSAQDLVSEAAQEYPSAASKPEQFIGYKTLLDAIKSNSITVDLIVLTTPSGLHSAQTIAAAEAGVHICTEKPMATSWEDGVSMVKACDEAGVLLFVVKKSIQQYLAVSQGQVEAGRFGQLAMVAVMYFGIDHRVITIKIVGVALGN